MNLYKISTIGLLTGIVVACGAAGTDATPVARADDGTAGAAPDCMCVGQAGPQGIPGPPGPTGPAGKDAVCGAGMNQCPAGVPGPAGVAGPKGSDGSSCSASGNGDSVHVTCTDGTTATLTAPAGVKGDKGDKGDPGAKGDTGSQGLPGDQGVPGKDGKEGTVITKQSVYTRTGAASSGTSYAYCDDNNDVVLTGGCSGSVPMAFNGPLFVSDTSTKTAWQCSRWGLASAGEVAVATIVCLEVP